MKITLWCGSFTIASTLSTSASLKSTHSISTWKYRQLDPDNYRWELPYLWMYLLHHSTSGMLLAHQEPHSPIIHNAHYKKPFPVLEPWCTRLVSWGQGIQTLFAVTPNTLSLHRQFVYLYTTPPLHLTTSLNLDHTVGKHCLPDAICHPQGPTTLNVSKTTLWTTTRTMVRESHMYITSFFALWCACSMRIHCLPSLSSPYTYPCHCPSTSWTLSCQSFCACNYVRGHFCKQNIIQIRNVNDKRYVYQMEVVVHPWNDTNEWFLQKAESNVITD